MERTSGAARTTPSALAIPVFRAPCLPVTDGDVQRGVPVGSRYYPRGVTAILWLDERPAGAKSSSR
ncbi:hypothetical protein WME90_25025 [Sorangium sp. So ce375]|uniref:hypothetical protein n=1 Tax=Sorangium sp. So ce375 TaxID=3133306 RepID=UPI003F5B0583